MILCRSCWARELDFRRERNQKLEKFAQYELPSWGGAEAYRGGE